jgi:hypothetical protein
MMNCAEARRLIDADPNAPATGALEEHLRGCAACRQWQSEMRALERAMRKALDVDLLDATGAGIAPAPTPSEPMRHRGPRLRPWAMAAGLLVALAAGAFVWIVRPADALAAEVVAHAEGEPASWSSEVPVPDAEVEAILHQAGVTLDPAATDVVYAHSCPFRGRQIPHLVVRTSGGPVTVLVLGGEHVPFRHHFSEEGFTGELVPSGPGSIAVLAQGSTQVDEAVRLVKHALHWNSESARDTAGTG